MAERTPQFDSPPVIETVLSAQFAPLPGFTVAHAGWFWQARLPKNWTTLKETPRLEDQHERFGDERVWQLIQPFVVRPVEEPNRLQIIRDDEERMIQIQNSRFILNWRRKSGDYPTYEVLHPEFQRAFQQFSNFVREEKLGEIELNHWEVTYVNHFPKGADWNSPSDWIGIFPWLTVPPIAVENTLDTLLADWRFVIGDNRGRLYLNFRHGKISMESPEALTLQMTARGPIKPESGMSIEDGLSLGHESIVDSFLALTSKEAQSRWGRKR